MKCTAEEFEAISKDSAYHDLGTLPSQGIPYKGRMDKLFIRPFRLAELRLLSKAAQLNELSHLIRAVDLVISHDVFDLTIGDFYYVLFWLRMYSMPDSPYVIEWDCDQPYYTHKDSKIPLLYSDDQWPTAETILKEYNVASCGTSNTSVINQASVEVICLEEDFVLETRFDFPRVRILENLNAAMLDAEMAMIAPAIQWLKGDTWEDKIKVAEGADSVNLISAALKVNREVVHGLNEEVTFSCHRCRIKHTQTLKLNALTFFP